MDDVKAHTRQRILAVAADLLENQGAQAVSTRSVAAAAGIRAASLYQLFGDKDGLLAAVAVQAFNHYLAEKRTVAPSTDPVEDLRRGWDAHVGFGLRHPAVYLLMFGTDRPGRRPPAADEAHRLLLEFLDRVAASGRLRVPRALAAHLCQAAATGVTLSLIATPGPERDPEISAIMRETLIGALTTDPTPDSDPALAARALALDAALTAAGEPIALRPPETALLRDWLQRLAR
ncbi:TetR/AcrR family transcriptional regulator [Dactylosporangium vinaceum]|uniref:TetR/AcrR family transcriptional regulator n=1 Tax=Dactylosporangium vinaceum TaxID=53362 RepID=A0ABV5MRW5_9ACTN|nr:TetR/AcrR family transcriptional regulator [Dactylosporangium vinaceum]UAC00324.1 TetR/AcrR family transcriptional regulator [Dactylosporangium vinaceum]